MEFPSVTDIYRYSEESLKTFFDNAGLGIYISDYYTGELLMHNNIYAWEMGRADGRTISGVCYRNAGYNERCPRCPYEKLIDKDGKPTGAYTWEHYFEDLGASLDFTSRAVHWIDGRLAHMITFAGLSKHRQTGDGRYSDLFDVTVELPDTACLEYDMMQNPDNEYLVALDIEGLRKINSIYGRNGGDQFLRNVRDYILGLKIPNASLYRLGVGDFGILIKSTCGDRELPGRIAETLRVRFGSEWKIMIAEYEQSVFAFANICIIPLEGNKFTSFRELHYTVSYALDIARNTGGIARYNDELDINYQYDTALEMSLENAVRKGMDGFYLEYQPIVRTDTYGWSGMEALCRWNSADFGAVSPGVFIPVAEARGLMRELGLWILEQAIVQVKHWRLDCADGFLLDVNLSPFQLSIPNFDQFVIEILTKYDYPPGKLCLEVTESGSLSFVKYVLEAIGRLCEAGVVIALDDFGTGFSTLSALHKLPVKVLKTDRSFLAEVDTDSKVKNLFHTIIALAHNSGMKIVAEGVETEEQVRFLIMQGADYLQGYYFSRPLSCGQIEKELDKFRQSGKGVNDDHRAAAVILGDALRHDLRLPLYKMLYNCIRRLFSGDDNNASIDLALEYLGRGLKVSRVYLFLSGTAGEACSNIHEWCAPGTASEKLRLQHISLEQEYPLLCEALKTQGMVIAPDTRSLRKGVIEELNAQGVKSILMLPVWRDNGLFGFLSFEDYEKQRYWSADEVQMLRTLNDIITQYLMRAWLYKEIEHQSLTQNIVFDSLDIAIHVTNPETHEILFVSPGMTRLYGGADLVGRPCWEALENRDEPCPFCPMPDLMENPGKLSQWDHYCEFLDRHLRVCSRMIPWANGRQAHLEYAHDVTELKHYQGQLETMATTDMLTHTLNRQTFLKTTNQMLAEAEMNNKPATLAFIDLDDLKLMNDTNGHAAGDELICDMVRALKENIRASDVLGRFGGDEFVVFFQNCSIKNADERMRSSLALLAAVTGVQGHKSSFSYGLAERAEVSGEMLSEHLNALIELADKRMLAQKKSNKKIEAL